MTEKLFSMVNKMSPNFKPCAQEKKSSSQKKVIAYLTLPCEALDGNSANYDIPDFFPKTHKLPLSSQLDKFAMTLVTKFKWLKIDENCQELMLSKSNKPFVEILAFKKHSSDKFWMIPSGHSRLKQSFKTQSNELKCTKMEDLSKSEYYEILKDLYGKIFVNSKIIYKGYLNDGRRKKNSLIEVIAENCHHFNDQIIEIINQAFGKEFCAENYCLKWLDIFDQKFYPPHRIVLKKCAKFLNAEWID